MAKEQNFPLIFCSAYPLAAGEYLRQADGGGIIPLSRILRSCEKLWRDAHRALVTQHGYSPLEATRYLLNQTEAKPAQPTFAPPQPQSPFAQPPINGVAANGR